MKKSIYLLIATAMSFSIVSCGELKVVMNRTENDGTRKIATSETSFFSNGNISFDIGAGIKVEKKDTLFGIFVISDSNTSRGIFSVGERMTIQLEDNSEIVLSNLLDKKFDSHVETNVTSVPSYGFSYAYSPWCPGFYASPYIAGGFATDVYTTTKSNSYAMYLITKEQILRIIEGNVTGLVVETDNQDCNMSNPGRTSGIFYRIFNCIVKAVSDI